MKKLIDMKARLRNPAFYVGMVAITAMLGQVTGLYHISDSQVATATNLLLTVLGYAGVIIDNSTPGFADKGVE